MRRAVERAFESRERCPRLREARRKIGPVHEHRLVLREEAAIVVQHTQMEALDLRVGRVDVHHVDAARTDRLVREAVIEPGRRPVG